MKNSAVRNLGLGFSGCSYLVKYMVEFSLLFVKVTGRNFRVIFIFLAQVVSFLAFETQSKKYTAAVYTMLLWLNMPQKYKLVT